MGVTSEPLWEVQWHGSAAGKVRRFYVTRTGLRWLIVLAALLGLVVLAVVGALPLGLQGYFQRFTVKAVRQENKRLVQQRQALLEEAREVAAEVATSLNRGLRFAWVMGVTSLPAPSELSSDAAPEQLIRWLEKESGKLLSLAEELARAPGPPCPLSSLPTAWPLDLPQAVPVGLFGVRVSPFTGQKEPHFGLTLAAPVGTKVLATGDGRVAYAGNARERRANQWSRLGTLVLLDHGGGTWSLYGHLEAVRVRPGQLVKRGQNIASVGTSGWTSVSALYFEVRWPVGSASFPVDPRLLQLALPMEDLEARLRDPTVGLGEGAPALTTLLGRAGR